MLSKTKLALVFGVVWGVAPNLVAAQAAPPTATIPETAQGGVTRLNAITVSATRTERRIDKVPSTVTVTSASKIEQDGARNIKDLLRDELDVTVRATAIRFTAASAATGRAGNEGINIRGLEGNQVLMMVDGVRLPNSFSFGAFATGRGDFIEVDGIKTVEVLRGAASTQFGSDGLAGAVSFRTLEPADLLKPGQSLGGFARTGYAAIDRSWSSSLGVAAANEQWQAMLMAGYRQGNEAANKGENAAHDLSRTRPNPLDYQNRYLSGKLAFALDASQQIGLSFESQQRTQNTEVYSARALPPLVATSTLDLDARDQIKRERISVEHRVSDSRAAWIQRAETRLYWQDAEVSQFAIEDRNGAADRTRDNRFNTKVIGFSTLLESNLTGWLKQRLSYGLDWSQAQINGVRDGTVAPFGETFPAKPFPDTRYTLGGAFLQSEIELGKLSLIPGLRFDHYQLSPSSQGYSGAKVVALSGQAVTPRLGGVWQLHPWFAPYGQYAKGFRAPTPDQVNNGFTNLASGYTSIGNPNLQAENAESVEIGVRGKIQGVRYAVTAFHNRYKNFIRQQAVSGAQTPANPTVFQYINLANARIQGLELRSEWQIDKAWRANAGFAYARGDSQAAGVSTPLDTVQPLKAVFGLQYADTAWNVRANLTHSAGKQRSRMEKPSAQFASPSYTVLDLGLTWKPMRHLSLNANLNNAFDRKYWRWSDVSGLPPNSPVQDAYSAAGRNAQFSVRYDF